MIHPYHTDESYTPAAFAWNFCPICGLKMERIHDGEATRPHCPDCRRFYYLNPIPAACCFVTQGDKVLLTRRAVTPCIGEWCLPGGFVELGETTEEAVLRELQEETSLIGSTPHLIGVRTHVSRLYGSVMIIGYAIETWEGTLSPGSDVMENALFRGG